MKQNRREFMTLAGAAAGALLTGCGSGAASQQPEPIAPAAPSESTPPPPSNPLPQPPPDPPPAVVDPRVAALQTYLKSHASPDFLLPAPGTEVPVISWAGPFGTADSAPTTLQSGIVYPVSDPLVSRPIAQQYTSEIPGNPAIEGTPCLRVNRHYSRKGMARSVGSVEIIRLRTDAAVIELTGVVPDGNFTVQTLIVDGRLVPAKVLTSDRRLGGWNVGTIRLDFGSRRIRDVWIETGLYVAYVRIGAGDLLLPMADSTEPQITAVGDSYLQVKSANFGNSGAIALSLAARLGIRKVATDAVGGTGYWNSSGDSGNLNDRLPGHAADNSSIYLVMAGLNDYADVLAGGAATWPARSVYENSVLGYLQGLRSAQPDALIVVTAPFCPNPTMSDSTFAVHPATNTSGTGDYLYKADLHRRSLQQIAPPWIYIDVLMGTGWLNSSGVTGDISNLQWFTGGTPYPGTTATFKPGNTLGGGGGGFGGIGQVPVLAGGRYTQAPEVFATGGSGSGLLLSSSIGSNGSLTSINVISPGAGYTTGAGLPTISIDPAYQIDAASAGVPSLLVGVNTNGQYPLLSFAPPTVSVADLNNIPILISGDTVHPSGVGAEYLAGRLARNIYEAVMAL